MKKRLAKITVVAVSTVICLSSILVPAFAFGGYCDDDFELDTWVNPYSFTFSVGGEIPYDTPVYFLDSTVVPDSYGVYNSCDYEGNVGSGERTYTRGDFTYNVASDAVSVVYNNGGCAPSVSYEDIFFKPFGGRSHNPYPVLNVTRHVNLAEDSIPLMRLDYAVRYYHAVDGSLVRSAGYVTFYGSVSNDGLVLSYDLKDGIELLYSRLGIDTEMTLYAESLNFSFESDLYNSSEVGLKCEVVVPLSEQIESFSYSTVSDFNSKNILQYDEISFEDIDLTSWLTNAVGGFLSFEIVPGISFAGILAVLVSSSLLIAFLKFFAG